jgi:hypothetical protein
MTQKKRKKQEEQDTREEQEITADTMRNDNTHLHKLSSRSADCWTPDSQSAHNVRVFSSYLSVFELNDVQICADLIF